LYNRINAPDEEIDERLAPLKRLQTMQAYARFSPNRFATVLPLTM